MRDRKTLRATGRTAPARRGHRWYVRYTQIFKTRASSLLAASIYYHIYIYYVSLYYPQGDLFLVSWNSIQLSFALSLHNISHRTITYLTLSGTVPGRQSAYRLKTILVSQFSLACEPNRIDYNLTLTGVAQYRCGPIFIHQATPSSWFTPLQW